MKLTTIYWNEGETACLVAPEGYIPLPLLRPSMPFDSTFALGDMLKNNQLDGMMEWFSREGKKMMDTGMFDHQAIPPQTVEYAPLYRNPSKIICIGLNFSVHAEELMAVQPDRYPGSFMKPDTTIIGHGDYIRIPALSRKTTAEAELGVIIGRKCRHVKPGQWRDVVAGFTPVLDMTAEDILKMNVRYLTASKSFDTFFSFGPLFVSKDEVPTIDALEIGTVRNGKVVASARVTDMKFPPPDIISFLSDVMTLMPGDIIATGTPGATDIAEGDVIECRITGLTPLINRVIDIKKGA